MCVNIIQKIVLLKHTCTALSYVHCGSLPHDHLQIDIASITDNDSGEDFLSWSIKSRSSSHTFSSFSDHCKSIEILDDSSLSHKRLNVLIQLTCEDTYSQ